MSWAILRNRLLLRKKMLIIVAVGVLGFLTDLLEDDEDDNQQIFRILALLTTSLVAMSAILDVAL